MKLLAWCLGHGKSPGWMEYQRGDTTCSGPTFPTAKGVRSDQAGRLQSQPMAQLVFTAFNGGAGILWVSGTLSPSVLGSSPPDQTDCSRQESLCLPASSRNSQHTLGYVQSIAAKLTFLDIHPKLVTSAVCCLQAA